MSTVTPTVLVHGLSPELWATCLEYLDLRDQLACATASAQFVRRVAPRLVRLNVRSPTGALPGGWAGRLFPNVTTIHHDIPAIQIIASKSQVFQMASQFVPFLLSFRKLRKVHLKTLTALVLKINYVKESSGFQADESDQMTKGYLLKMIEFIIFGLCGAYSSGALSKEVEILGVMCSGYLQKATRRCRICEQVHRSFPPDKIFEGLCHRPPHTSQVLLESSKVMLECSNAAFLAFAVDQSFAFDQ